MGMIHTVSSTSDEGANFDVEAPAFKYLDYRVKQVSDTSPIVSCIGNGPIWPVRRSAIAAESPPMPPPTMAILSRLNVEAVGGGDRGGSMRKWVQPRRSETRGMHSNRFVILSPNALK